MYAKEADFNKSSGRKDPNKFTLFVLIYTLTEIISHREGKALEDNSKLVSQR